MPTESRTGVEPCTHLQRTNRQVYIRVQINGRWSGTARAATWMAIGDFCMRCQEVDLFEDIPSRLEDTYTRLQAIKEAKDRNGN